MKIIILGGSQDDIIISYLLAIKYKFKAKLILRKEV